MGTRASIRAFVHAGIYKPVVLILADIRPAPGLEVELFDSLFSSQYEASLIETAPCRSIFFSAMGISFRRLATVRGRSASDRFNETAKKRPIGPKSTE